MSMTRRLALLLLAVLLPALLGSLALHQAALRAASATQLQVRNAEAAASLALALSMSMSQQGVRLAQLQPVASAHFDLGHYRALRLLGPAGQVLFERLDPGRRPAVPGWFLHLLPLDVPPGVARVGDGGADVSRVEVQTHADQAWVQLWSSTLRAAGLSTLFALLATALATALLRGWRRPLLAAVAQAQALQQGRFVQAEVPPWPELAQLTCSMNSMVDRLRQVFDAQAGQVALLRRQAHADVVTGLPRREHFIDRLQELLADAGAPPSTLLLLRARRLDEVNRRLGHDGTDRLLASLAELLQTYVQRVAGAAAGRLNGSDFALCLPASGVAQETADSLRAALSASPLTRSGGARWALGGVEGLQGGSAGAALAAADAALAESEADLEGASVIHAQGELVADPAGARAWREQISAALAEGRVRLAALALRDLRGRLLHLECSLQVQLQPGGDFHAARRWLALAGRSRLLPEVDRTAVRLALQASSSDGLPRAVRVSADSLAEPGSASALGALLAAQPTAAALLWLDLPEHLGTHAAGHPEDAPLPGLRDTLAGWRARSVRVGVEHAGAAPQALAGLSHLGLDYVKVAARHLRGVADDAPAREHASGLLALVHGMGLQALAEGITDPRDLVALWALGWDGATGAAVAPHEGIDPA